MNNIYLHINFICNNLNKVFVCLFVCLFLSFFLSFYVSLLTSLLVCLLACCLLAKNISQLPSASDMMKNCFTELRRLYRYESRSHNLHCVRQWRASDLLVWDSADTIRKEKWSIFQLLCLCEYFACSCYHIFNKQKFVPETLKHFPM